MENSGQNVGFGMPMNSSADMPVNSSVNPVQDGSGGNSGIFQPVPGSVHAGRKPMWQKWGILGVIVVAVVTLLIIFVMKFVGGPDYGASYRLATELYEELYDVMGAGGSCYNMIRNESNSDVGATKYQEYVTGCKEDIIKVRDLADRLGKSSGITKDSDLKKKYDAMAEVMNRAVPKKQNLDKMEKVFVAVHDFALRLGDIGSDSSESEIKNVAKVLIDSGSEDWAEFGKGWESRMLKYVQAYRAYENASYSDANYSSLRNAYSEALSEVRDYLSEFDSNDWDNGGINAQAIDDWNDAAYELRTDVRELYEKNYDGKGGDDCTDFGDGEASCR